MTTFSPHAVNRALAFAIPQPAARSCDAAAIDPAQLELPLRRGRVATRPRVRCRRGSPRLQRISMRLRTPDGRIRHLTTLWCPATGQVLDCELSDGPAS